MGEMRRANAREEEARLRDRFASTVTIAAAIWLLSSTDDSPNEIVATASRQHLPLSKE